MDLPLLDSVAESLDGASWWQLVGREEHERLDFKRQLGRSLTDLLPAMAMTDGGLVVVGIDDARRVVGATLDQRLRDVVADAVHASRGSPIWPSSMSSGDPIFLSRVRPDPSRWTWGS